MSENESEHTSEHKNEHEIEHKFVNISTEDFSIEAIRGLVAEHKNFRISGIMLGDFDKYISKTESEIESIGLSCRVYTEDRSKVLFTGLIPNPIAWGVTAAYGLGIAAHNLATLNPDYEIGRNILNNYINVTYKKTDNKKEDE